jgi:hypothetical protein
MKYRWLHPYPGYSVSADGNVRSGANRIAIHKLPDGTPFVRINVLGRRVSLPVDTLVAWAFLGKPPGRGYMVAHLNGDKSDCRAKNLDWVVDEDYWFDFYRRLMMARR